MFNNLTSKFSVTHPKSEQNHVHSNTKLQTHHTQLHYSASMYSVFIKCIASISMHTYSLIQKLHTHVLTNLQTKWNPFILQQNTPIYKQSIQQSRNRKRGVDDGLPENGGNEHMDHKQATETSN